MQSMPPVRLARRTAALGRSGYEGFGIFRLSPNECGPTAGAFDRRPPLRTGRRHAHRPQAYCTRGWRQVSGLALLADVGGTNVRFALADPAASAPLSADSIQTYAVADYRSLADAARHYLDANDVRASHGVFAIAGRVERDQARMTNHPWVVSRRLLRDTL